MEVYENIPEMSKYEYVTPKQLLDAFHFLEIKKNEIDLYWIGRVYCSIPLPIEMSPVLDAKNNLLYY